MDNYGVAVYSGADEILSTYTPFNFKQSITPKLGTHSVVISDVLGTIKPVILTNQINGNNNLFISSLSVSGNKVTYTAESFQFGSTRFTGSEIHIYVYR